MDVKELIEALTIKEDLINVEAKQDNTWGSIVRRELAKLGLHINPKEKDFTLPVADLIDFADAIYQMGFEDGANSLNENINENALERYLSVEPIEGGFIPNTDIEYNANIVLYNGDKVVDQIMIPLYYDEIKGNKDDYIRGIAKQHFDNISDDIRVAWY